MVENDECIKCIDQKVEGVVRRVLESVSTSMSSIFIKYLLKNRDGFIDHKELALLSYALLDERMTESEILSEMDFLCDILHCELGIELIEYVPEKGYRVSRRCALLRKASISC